MKKSNRSGYRSESWKQLQKIIALGHSRDKVFHDWLDLMLVSALALKDNVSRLNLDFTKFDGKYEDQYHKINARYDNGGKQGERPIDYFTKAYAALIQEINETDKDVLGDIYMLEITYGEHGQVFTPEHITDMMAMIVSPSKSEECREVVCDPCCGSGRMLLSAHKHNPNAFLVGIDLDPRCAKMCALNLILREMEGDVYCGNSLMGKMDTVWMIRNGWVQEQEKPETPDRIKNLTEEETEQLSLLAA